MSYMNNYNMLRVNSAYVSSEYTSTQLKLNSAAGRSALINYCAAGKFITTNTVPNNGSSECLATLSSPSVSLGRSYCSRSYWTIRVNFTWSARRTYFAPTYFPSNLIITADRVDAPCDAANNYHTQRSEMRFGVVYTKSLPRHVTDRN